MFAHPVVVVLTAATAMLTCTRLYQPSWVHTNWIFHGSSIAMCSQLWIITASTPLNQVALLFTLSCFVALLIAVFTRQFIPLALSSLLSTGYFFCLYLSGPVMQAIYVHMALACLLMANCAVGVLQIIHIGLQQYRLERAKPPLAHIPPLEILKQQVRYTGIIGFALVTMVIITCLHQLDHHTASIHQYFNEILTAVTWSLLGYIVWQPSKSIGTILPLVATLLLATISISCLFIGI
jgi:hypothetical protein